MKQAILILFFSVSAFIYSNAQTEQIRPLEKFSKIQYEGHGSIFLEQGTQPSIKIQTGTDAYIKNVVSEIRGETLFIWYELQDAQEYTIAQPRVDIYLTYEQLSAITVFGRVRVDANETIKGDQLSIYAEGYIDLDMKIEVDHLEAYAEGSIEMALSGKTNSQSIILEGLGSVNAFELSSNDAKAKVDGFGSIYLSAQDALEAIASGLSKIIYTGDPAKKVFNKNGNVSIKSREI